MWAAARRRPSALRAALAGAAELEQRMLRLFGIPESEIARTLRGVAADGVDARARWRSRPACGAGSSRSSTRYEPRRGGDYDAFEAAVRERHARRAVLRATGRRSTRSSPALLRGRRLDGRDGRVVHRRADGGPADRPARARRPTCSAALVVYSNEAKAALAGVDPRADRAHGAVSPEVAAALADGARGRFGADVGDRRHRHRRARAAGRAEKPVGTVCLCVAQRAAGRARGSTRTVQLPGGRADVRDRTTRSAMHLLRRLLLRRGLRRRRRGRGASALFVAARRCRAAGRATALVAPVPRRRPPTRRPGGRVRRERAAPHARVPRAPAGRPSVVAARRCSRRRGRPAPRAARWAARCCCRRAAPRVLARRARRTRRRAARRCRRAVATRCAARRVRARAARRSCRT